MMDPLSCPEITPDVNRKRRPSNRVQVLHADLADVAVVNGDPGERDVHRDGGREVPRADVADAVAKFAREMLFIVVVQV